MLAANQNNSVQIIKEYLDEFLQLIGIAYNPDRDTVKPPGYKGAIIEFEVVAPKAKARATTETPQGNTLSNGSTSLHHEAETDEETGATSYSSTILRNQDKDQLQIAQLIAIERAAITKAGLDYNVAAQIKADRQLGLGRSKIVAKRSRLNLKHKGDGTVKEYIKVLRSCAD